MLFHAIFCISNLFLINKEKLLSEDLFHGGLVFYLKNDGLFGSTFCLEEWVVKLSVPLYFKKN